MKSLLFWLFLVFLCGSTGRACPWVDGTTLEGKFISVGLPMPPEGTPPFAEVPYMTNETFRARNHSVFLRAIAVMSPEKVLEVFAESPMKLPDHWPLALNDAVRPIFARDFRKSAKMLADLNATYPNNYYILANLGVTSELAGNDAEALKWVEKAMRLNPGAHHGTEWMHAAVLRAKLAMANEPAWLETHTISGIPLGEVPADFSLSEEGRNIKLQEIQNALFAHLIPRLLLVKGPDRIVAALLTELARVEARAVSVEAGIAMLKLAAEHGAINTEPTLNAWEDRVAQRKKWDWWRKNKLWIYPLVFGVISISALRFFLRRRSRSAARAA